ncbi:hypothetical protein ACTXOJ_09395 [Glutamicibacter arilaitensis]|uniref:hypothetical protein n=1 Tax=Glutamicibacter arilaitensis TaxID=256701 RepID=UPI003FD378D4
MRTVKTIKQSISSLSRKVGYSPAGREVARQILDMPEKTVLRTKLKDLGVEGKLRHMATEALPEGQFYAKLFIKNWRRYLGKEFQLLENGRIVYGNTIEAPLKGMTLEYRNIVVSSSDLSHFSLDIDAPFTMSIGPGAFYTPQQDHYDKKYSVKRHGRLHYATRGNAVNPEKIIFTFPSFSSSTSTTPYMVSFLSGIKDAELEKTLLVCFQDRFGTSGTYMQMDNSGLDLTAVVSEEIEKIRTRFNVDEKYLMFYGVSKGGSIAIRYSQPYPKSRLVISCPQLHLGYYLKNSSFKDSLGRSALVHQKEQPHRLLSQFIDQNRSIDYLYSTKDETSNYSLAEQLDHSNGLNLLRIDGIPSEVARKSLPTVLNILRSFIGTSTVSNVILEQVRVYPNDSGHRVQVRIGAPEEANTRTNWYLIKRHANSAHAQLLTQGALRFVKYTTDAQQIFSSASSVYDYSEVVGYQVDGTMWVATNHKDLQDDAPKKEAVGKFSAAEIALALYEKSRSKCVKIIDHDQNNAFKINIPFTVENPSKVIFTLVDPGSQLLEADQSSIQQSSTVALVQIEILESTELLPILINRIMIDSLADSYEINNLSTLATDSLIDGIHATLPGLPQ